MIPLFLASVHPATAEEDPGQRYLLAASKEGVSPLNKEVYKELAQLYRGRFAILEAYGDCSYFVPPPPLDTSKLRPPHDAMAKIYNMGLDALPVLTEALDDSTPTKNVWHDPHLLYSSRSVIGTWKVNDLVGMLICAITNRDFVIVEDGHEHTIRYIGRYIGSSPKLVPRFRKLVLDWYAQNAKRTQAQRWIADVGDEFTENRCHAIGCIGYKKEKAGQDAIIKNVDRILADNKHIDSSAYELAESALALGQLGDPGSLETVRRICRHLSVVAEVNDLKTYSCFPGDLFRAYYGLSLLGKKDEAMDELERLGKHVSAHGDPDISKRYQEKLKAIRTKKNDKYLEWTW